MADILLSNEDLTIFGGPETISLDLDYGPQGDRGSIIYVSNVNGGPLHTETNKTFPDAQIYDIAIDTNPANTSYKKIFQLIQGPQSKQWVEFVSLKTNFYSAIKGPYTPADGKITISPINVTDIYDLGEGTVSASNFSVQYSVSSSDISGPLATTLVIKDLETTQGFLALPLEIKGVEYIDGNWSAMTGPKYVHLFITVV
jgi:hypothetical protein